MLSEAGKTRSDARTICTRVGQGAAGRSYVAAGRLGEGNRATGGCEPAVPQPWAGTGRM